MTIVCDRKNEREPMEVNGQKWHARRVHESICTESLLRGQKYVVPVRLKCYALLRHIE
jgi:hypothetical protein